VLSELELAAGLALPSGRRYAEEYDNYVHELMISLEGIY
jgi:hypothetical protein